MQAARARSDLDAAPKVGAPRGGPVPVVRCGSTLALAIALALAVPQSHALGLGSMQTHSALNQPFYAEIALFDVDPEELDAVNVRLASREEFDKAGADRPHFLTRLQFTPAVGRGDSPVLQVTSREPMREPYLAFLVEVVWPEGRLVKEFATLLDPPATRAAGPVPPASAPSVARRAPPQPRPRASRTAAPAPTEARAAAPAAAVPQPVPPEIAAMSFPLSYGPVANGVGLWRIARQMTPPGATVEQTAMALYRSNQHAFVRGDINVLKQGAELDIPSAAELFALDTGSAKRQFVDALAGRGVPSQPLAGPATGESRLTIAGGPDAGADDAGRAAGGFPDASPETLGAIEEDLLLVREVSETNRQETTELRTRIQELEGQLTDIRQLLNLRNEQVAQLRDALKGADTAGLGADYAALLAATALPGRGLEPLPEPAAGAADPADGVAAVQGVAEPVSLLPSPEPPEPADLDEQPQLVAVQEEPGFVTPAADVSAPEPDQTEDPRGDAVARAAAGGNGGGGAASSAPSTVAPPAGGEAPTPPSGFPEVVADSGFFLSPVAMGAAGLGVLVGALGLVMLRRRRRSDAEADAALAGEYLDVGVDAPESSDVRADASGGGHGAQIPGTVASVAAASHGWHTETDQATDAVAVDGHRSDVLEEAEIYILYGRYREAEAILTEELARSPNLVAAKYKLAQAYIGSGNRQELVGLLDRMRAAGEDRADPDAWKRITADFIETTGKAPGIASAAGGVAGIGADGAAAAPPLSDREPDLTDPELTAADLDDGLGLPGLDEIALDGGDLDIEGVQASRREVSGEDLEDLPESGDFLDGFPTFAADRPSDRLSERDPLEATMRLSDDAASEDEGFDLDLDLEELEKLITRHDASVDRAETEQDDLPGVRITAAASDGVDIWDEIATKMDLARAYVEMQDADAARTILEEVVQDGDASQQAEARRLLGQLG